MTTRTGCTQTLLSSDYSTFSFFIREIAFSIAYSSAKQHWSFLSSSSIACARRKIIFARINCVFVFFSHLGLFDTAAAVLPGVLVRENVLVTGEFSAPLPGRENQRGPQAGLRKRFFEDLENDLEASSRRSLREFELATGKKFAQVSLSKPLMGVADCSDADASFLEHGRKRLVQAAARQLAGEVRGKAQPRIPVEIVESRTE